MKVYLLDDGWEGSHIVLTGDPSHAYNVLIKPRIDMYHSRAMLHDAHWPADRPNPWWQYHDSYKEKGLDMCQIFDVEEGLEITTSGE